MSEETDRRIEAARLQAQRVADADEFMKSLSRNDELVRPIVNPEAYVMREKLRGAANRGELPRSECTHPMQNLQQYIDDDPGIKRAGRPVNLFECGRCHMLLWLVDPWGRPVTDD